MNEDFESIDLGEALTMGTQRRRMKRFNAVPIVHTVTVVSVSWSMYRWCEYHCGDNWAFDHVDWSDLTVIYFAHKDDLLMFMLKYGDHIHQTS